MLYTTYSSMNDYERLSNSTALTELGIWLGKQKNIPTDSGRITKITTGSGMLIAVPQENEFDGVQYQLQIIAEYTLEE